MGRILVVDDDPDILKVSEAVLSGAGHTVILAEDALTAIDLLNKIEFDLLLSDANMPHYSGFDLVNTIRKDPKFKELSIAMLTGRSERRDIERAMQIGVDDYIVKPLDPLILLQKLGALFEKRPARQFPEIYLKDEQTRGELRSAINVETISEFAVYITTDLALRPGAVLDIKIDFFATIGAVPPPMKVQSVEFDETTGRYKVQLAFLGAREPFLQKIRRYLYSHGGSNKAAA